MRPAPSPILDRLLVAALRHPPALVVRVRWEKRGGPPVSARQRSGFGPMTITRSPEFRFAGEVALDPASAGFAIDLDAPLFHAGQQGTAS